MFKVIEQYGYPYDFTQSILQDVRKKAKFRLFGMADDNAMYTNGVVSELKNLGHYMELLFSTRAKVVSKLGVVLMVEENCNRELKQQLQIEPEKLSEYAAKWRFKHILVKLEKQVGIKDGPHFNLVSGILFAPLSLTPTVPLLQRVIQADATHIVLGNILYYFPG